jgi:hypothetical protein
VSHRLRLAVSCLLVAAIAPLAVRECRAQSAAPGFSLDEIQVAPAGAFVGGFEVLPNGNWALFDGSDVVELSSLDGSFVRTLFTPPVFTFGAFLTLSPDGSKLYFGESSSGRIYEIDLASLAANVVLTTVYPYDLAFDPQGRPFLSYALGFGMGSYVALCDFSNGTLDDVIVSSDPSGPLAFDAAGDLVTATPDATSFPPPADATEVLRFAAADVALGIGPGTISTSLGSLLGNVDGAAYLALDEAGDVLVADANSGKLVDLDSTTLAETVIADAGPFNAFLYVRHVRGTRGAFEPWQPEEAGELLALRSDFFSFNDLTRVRPARPRLTTNPPSSIPKGRWELAASVAVPDGFGLLLVGDSLAPAERQLRNRTWPAPLFVGLSPTSSWSVVALPTDADGEWSLMLDNPGLGGVTVAAQLVVGASSQGPFYGTSAPISFVLQ